MELFASLLKGYTPILIFIFLCFASLLVMFFKLLRGLEEMLQGLSGDRNAVVQQLMQIKEQLELLTRQQVETGKTLKIMQAPDFVAGAPATAEQAETYAAPFSAHAVAAPEGKTGQPWGVAAAGVAVGAAAAAAVLVGANKKDSPSATPLSFTDAAGSQELSFDDEDEISLSDETPGELSFEDAEKAATAELIMSMDTSFPPSRPAVEPKPTPAMLELGDVDMSETLDLSKFTADEPAISFDMDEPEIMLPEEEARVLGPESGEEPEFELSLLEPELESAPAPKGLAADEEIDLFGSLDLTPGSVAHEASSLDLSLDEDPPISFDSNLFLEDEQTGPVEPLPQAKQPAGIVFPDDDSLSFDESGADSVDIDLSADDEKELDLLVEDLVDLPDETGKDQKTIAEDEAPYEEAEVILDDDDPETELDIMLDGQNKSGGNIEFALEMEPEKSAASSDSADFQLEGLELMTERDLLFAPAPAATPPAKPATPAPGDSDEIDLLDFTAEEFISPAAKAKPAPQGAPKGKQSNIVDFILDE